MIAPPVIDTLFALLVLFLGLALLAQVIRESYEYFTRSGVRLHRGELADFLGHRHTPSLDPGGKASLEHTAKHSVLGAIHRWASMYSFRVLATLSLVLLCAPSAGAQSSVTATKSCVTLPGTTTLGSFSILTPQIIAWSATYNPVSGCNATGFHLSTVGPNYAHIALTTSGVASGTQYLAAGTYHISINTIQMGQGSYTIEYDRTASISVTSGATTFGSELTGNSSPLPGALFTIASTGSVAVTNLGVSSSDPAHFEVLSAPTGQQVPSDKTFRVRFHAGATPGTWSGTITVSGTSSIGAVSPATIMVSGQTLAREPNIACGATSDLGSADWFIGEVKTVSRSFNNTTGTDPLTLSSILLLNDSPSSAFALVGTPSLSPVPTGGSRSVAIQFAPPNTGVDNLVYSGHLEIHSNDPDEPIKRCDFTALAHHPVPRMRVASTVLDYRDVELGFAFTKAILIYNDGDAPLDVSVTDISTGNPTFAPNLAHWSSLDVGGPRTVTPLGPPAEFKEVYEPQALGSHTIQLRVSGNDLSNPTQDVTLTGVGASPIPIDNVLVLDRSGSMNQSAGPRRKIDALQTAADLYVHLLRAETGAGTGDKLGLVRYNHNNDEYLSLDFLEPTAAPGNHLADAEAKLSPAVVAAGGGLEPSGATGIGGAIERAAGMLPLPSGGRKHVMVVLTDGMQTASPWVSDVLGPVRSADPELRMYSIGLGTQIDPATLQEITNTVNGYHQVVDDLSGTSHYELETFYFKIFSNASGMQLVVDPTIPVLVSGTNPVAIFTAHIVSSDLSAAFLVLDEPSLRAFYNLELVDPQGHVIVLGSTVGGIPVHRLQRYNYTIYRVVFPDVAMASSYVGDWVLRLTPNGKWNTPARMDTHGPVGGVMGSAQGLVPVGFAAAVKSNYRLDVAVLPSSYLPGAQVTLTASLSDRGWPSVSGDVLVDVTTPSKTVHASFRLYDDGTHGDATAGDGTWTSVFMQTAETGSYKFFFHAIGKNDRGELAPRQETRYATLMAVRNPPGSFSSPCIPCALQKLLWVLILVLILWLLVLVARGWRPRLP